MIPHLKSIKEWMHNIYKIPASVQMENIFVQIGNIFVEITKVYLSKFDMQAPRAGCNLRHFWVLINWERLKKLCKRPEEKLQAQFQNEKSNFPEIWQHVHLLETWGSISKHRHRRNVTRYHFFH